jgi:hypothetical protein
VREPEAGSDLDHIMARPSTFVSGTSIALSLAVARQVTTEVFDAGGRWVRILADAWLREGSHMIAWDGLDAAGPWVLPGVY